MVRGRSQDGGEVGEPALGFPTNTAVLSSEHLENQEYREQNDRKINTGGKRQLGGTEVCAWELGEIKWAA